jgi:hypothetical protein
MLMKRDKTFSEQAYNLLSRDLDVKRLSFALYKSWCAGFNAGGDYVSGRMDKELDELAASTSAAELEERKPKD